MFRRLLLAAVVTLAVALPSFASATPTDSYFAWQIWGYVDWYVEKNNGDVVVYWEDGNGTRITNWPNSGGVNQCPANDGLVISSSHPLFERLAKAAQTGGLARRKFKIAYEGVGGVCYIKQLLVEM